MHTRNCNQHMTSAISCYVNEIRIFKFTVLFICKCTRADFMGFFILLPNWMILHVNTAWFSNLKSIKTFLEIYWHSFFETQCIQFSGYVELFCSFLGNSDFCQKKDDFLTSHKYHYSYYLSDSLWLPTIFWHMWELNYIDKYTCTFCVSLQYRAAVFLMNDEKR